MSIAENDYIEAYIHYQQVKQDKYCEERHFYLALNGSRQDKCDYLVWVETDHRGRILHRLRGRNWGENDKKDYEERCSSGEALRRSDGFILKVLGITDTQVNINYQMSTDVAFQKVYHVPKPWLFEEPSIDNL